jgi:hypothetical protein
MPGFGFSFRLPSFPLPRQGKRPDMITSQSSIDMINCRRVSNQHPAQLSPYTTQDLCNTIQLCLFLLLFDSYIKGAYREDGQGLLGVSFLQAQLLLQGLNTGLVVVPLGPVEVGLCSIIVLVG